MKLGKELQADRNGDRKGIIYTDDQEAAGHSSSFKEY